MSERTRAALGGVVRAVWVAAAAAGATAALAAPPELRSEGGLLVLPNVRVEQATQPVDGQASSRESGMKAFRDRETGQLRPALPEDLLATEPRARNAATAAQVSVSGNRKSARLDESYMSYAVVRKDADGRLDMTCVNGEGKALGLMLTRPEKKEHRHAH